MVPWDQRLARQCVKVIASTSITPNQITLLTLTLAVAGAGLLATGDATHANWGAGIFVLARFMDHFDGELARLTGNTSRLGYYLDYTAGALSYCALFIGAGIGLRHGWLGGWALGLGCAAAAAAIIAMPLNMAIDSMAGTDSAVGYPSVAGFELEDGIYLVAPITWLGFLEAFLVLAGIGALASLGWTAWTWLRARSR